VVNDVGRKQDISNVGIAKTTIITKGSEMKINERKLQRIIKEELGDGSVRELRRYTGDFLLDFLEIQGAWEIVEAIRNPTEPDSLIYVWNELIKNRRPSRRTWTYDFPLDGFGVQGVSFEEMGIRDAKINLSVAAKYTDIASIENDLEDYGAPSAEWFRRNVGTDIEIRVPADFDRRPGKKADPGETIPLIKLYSGVFRRTDELDSVGTYSGHWGEAPELDLVMPPRAENAIMWFLRKRAAAVFEAVIRRQVRRILAGA
jgi:hypothetical protein